MKKFMTILTMITLVGSLVFTTSCKKKEEDLPKPAVQNTKPVVSSDYSGGNITVDASDVDGSVSMVELFNGSTRLEFKTSAPFTFNVSTLPAGTYNLTVRVTDNSGGVTNHSVAQFTVTSGSNINPTVSATYNSETITVTTSDVDGSVSNIKIYNGTTLLTTLSTSPYTYSVGSLSPGEYTYTIVSTDNDGGINTTTVTFTVVSTNVAPTFTSTDLGSVSNGSTTYPVTISTNDGDNDVVTIVGTPTSTDGVTISGVNGKSFNVVTPSNQYSKLVTISVIITDGNGHSVPGNVTLRIGTVSQGNTYGDMSGYLNRTLSPSNPSGLRFNSNGTVLTGSFSTTFWGGNGVTSGSWVLNTDGTITITASSYIKTYTVTKFGINLYLNDGVTTQNTLGGQ